MIADDVSAEEGGDEGADAGQDANEGAYEAAKKRIPGIGRRKCDRKAVSETEKSAFHGGLESERSGL